MPRALAICLLAVAAIAISAQTQPNPDLDARPITFPAKAIPLNDVLAQLEKQTGNKVIDRRTTRTNPEIQLTTTTFWKTLDAIGKQEGIGFSAYQEYGGVALIDRAYRETKVDYSGAFRFAFKQIAVVKDEETDTHDCRVTLSAAWEPRIQPFFVNVEGATAVLGKRSETMPREAMRYVAGKGATEIELRMPPPPRAVAAVASLKGNLRVIGAPKMLEFTFDKIGPTTKPRQAKPQEGVQVSLIDLKHVSTSHWQIEVQIANPPGAIVSLDSFQSQAWLENNRMWLAWTDPNTKASRMLEPDPTTEERTETENGMKVSFRFRPRNKTPMPAPGADVSLHYLTPNRVVAFTVPFAFQDLPLP
jgi:hypothetical protein